MLRNATRLARERADRVLSEHGVYVGQQFVLEELWREDGTTPGELARRVGVSTPAVVGAWGATRLCKSARPGRPREGEQGPWHGFGVADKTDARVRQMNLAVRG